MARLSGQYSNNLNIQYIHYIPLPYFLFPLCRYIFSLLYFSFSFYIFKSLPINLDIRVERIYFLFFLFILYAFYIFAFDEGRTLPNLLGYLWSRKCPVHASESWPVFFRSIGRPFIFSAPFWMTSQFRCAKDAASCIAVCRTFEDVVFFIINFLYYDNYF